MSKRYGLLGSAKSIKASSVAGAKPAFKPARKAPARGTAVSAFAQNDSDSDDAAESAEDPMGRAAVNRRLREAQAARASQLDKAQVAAVLADPSVYDYDNVYEEVHADRKEAARAAEAKQAAEKARRAPRYISNLLDQAKMREVEQDRVYDRKLAKEREEGDKEHGEAEMKFVTGAYKRKLIEQEKWQLAQALEEQKEKAAEEHMKKQGSALGGGMAGFYSNLLTKNIAMGGDVGNATSAFTAGSKRHAVTAGLAMDGSSSSRKPGSKRSAAAAADSGSDNEQAAAAAASSSDAAAPSARMRDERSAAAASQQQQQPQPEREPAASAAAAEAEAARKRQRTDSERAGQPLTTAAATASAEAADSSKALAAAAEKAKADKAALIAAAKARALTRKSGAQQH
jgi:coiled-coil domain-containing protein 55